MSDIGGIIKAPNCMQSISMSLFRNAITHHCEEITGVAIGQHTYFIPKVLIFFLNGADFFFFNVLIVFNGADKKIFQPAPILGWLRP